MKDTVPIKDAYFMPGSTIIIYYSSRLKESGIVQMGSSQAQQVNERHCPIKIYHLYFK